MNTETDGEIVGRVPPHSVEAEERLLSCCFMDNGHSLALCIEGGVSPWSFYIPRNRQIFAVMLSLHADGDAVDEPSILTRLSSEPEGAAWWATHLTRISKTDSSTLHLPLMLKVVREMEVLRNAITSATSLVEAAYQYGGDEGVSDWLGSHMDRLQRCIVSGAKLPTWGDHVREAEALLRQRMEGPGALGGAWQLSWGFPALDYVLGPMLPGEVIILAARPSVGKSSLARQVAWSAAEGAEEHVLFISREMSGPTVAAALASNVSGIRSVRDLHLLHPVDQGELLRGVKLLGESERFHFSDRDASLMQILGRADALQSRLQSRTKGNRLRLLIIDYLGLVSDISGARAGDKVAAIGRVTGALKQWALRNEAVVLCLCQLNRSSEKEGREPEMHDLRDSGDIEQDADRVVFLDRPAEVADDLGMVHRQRVDASISDEPRWFVNVLCKKGRNTGTGRLPLMFIRETATFREIIRQSNGGPT
ncbi:hypothetical protein Ga0100231_005160 [Opitutaceae bacterium TAV4]|nr:hypothetical protein Ga0100231_005160 [Opitutaceae bacterium TAV4]RRK02380.1 hypothetical protein Ga0100230_004290 [Opitutaceae bacterium TAV3]